MAELIGIFVAVLVGPAVLSVLQTRARRAERAVDYMRRQEETAAREAREDEVAERAEAARLALVAQNALVAARADQAQESLTVIHTLVNSDMTKAKEGELIAQCRVAELLSVGTDTDPDELAAVEGRVAQLEQELAQRRIAAQQLLVEGP